MTHFGRGNPKLSNDQWDELVKRYKDGESAYKLAKSFDLAEQTINAKMKELGLSRPKRTITLELAKQMKEDRLNKKTYLELSIKYNFNDAAIIRALRKYFPNEKL